MTLRILTNCKSNQKAPFVQSVTFSPRTFNRLAACQLRPSIPEANTMTLFRTATSHESSDLEARIRNLKSNLVASRICLIIFPSCLVVTETYMCCGSELKDMPSQPWQVQNRNSKIMKTFLSVKGKAMWKAQQAKEKSGAARKRGALDFARRVPLKRKMEESASHHKFTFSFALLRADSLKKCANGRRREPKWPNIWNSQSCKTTFFD